jgi:non-heme chloroperoxidase
MSTDPPAPVVLIHGLWIHPAAWQSWFEPLEEAGYDPIAPGWPGVAHTPVATRADPAAVAGFSITDIVDHYARIIAGLPVKPVVIGHSFGGLIAQNLLGRDLAAAAVAIDPAPIKGVLPVPLSTLRSAFVALGNPGNRSKAVALNAAQFRYAFGNALPADESDELYARWTIPGPARPLFEAAFANFSLSSPAKVATRNTARGPLLLISGGKDHIVPPAVVKSAHRQYRRSSAVTELREFPDRGHSLTLDRGWREIAGAAVTWLGKHHAA